MNINRRITRWIVSTSVSALLAAMSMSCASTDQQSGYEDEYGDDYGSNYGNYDDSGEAVNNAASNEYGAGEEYGDNYGYSNYGNGGEGVNNYSYNEFENGEELALEDGGYDNELALGNNYGNYTEYSDNTYGEYTNNAEEGTDDLLAENAGLNLTGNVAADSYDTYGADAAPVNAAMDAPMLDAPVNAAAPMASSGGVVKYIRETTDLLNSPNGQAIGSALVGEHPVVWDEGNFHRDSKGRYIPTSALSISGVGRPREGGSWRSSGGGGY